MRSSCVRAAWLVLSIGAVVAACRGTPPPLPNPPPAPVPQPPAAAVLPDAVPRVEPRSRNGNPPFYEAFGKRYYVMPSSVGYRERGVASWYGPGFHAERTSMGERYDMYAMTAAHKTLPLPAYVRVINLENGRSVVLRVNDRGPFVNNRIIDLSYAAAAKLDMLRNGTAMVEVRAIDPANPEERRLPDTASATATGAASPAPKPQVLTTAAAPPPKPQVVTTAAPPPAATSAPATASVAAAGPAAGLFIQAGAFANPANAERMAATLRSRGFGNVFVRDDDIAGRRMYRVRLGPVADVAGFDRIVTALEKAGVSEPHLALDQ